MVRGRERHFEDGVKSGRFESCLAGGENGVFAIGKIRVGLNNFFRQDKHSSVGNLAI
jgi:hypothetical protein